MKEVQDNLIKDETSDEIIRAAAEIVTESGEVTVSKILKRLSVTNRVFYNRFHNVEEVLKIVYEETAEKVRESLEKEYDGKQDFFDYVVDVVADTLVLSYEVKMKFNQYVFEADSLSDGNYEWYMNRIEKLFKYAHEHGLIGDIDDKAMGYAIWCFCRGYNADAVVRVPKDEAIRDFKYSFRILLNGLKIENNK